MEPPSGRVRRYLGTIGESFEVTESSELAHAATIRKRLQQSYVLLQRFDLASDDYTPVGSIIAGDDSATAPFQTSHTVATALTMATENIRSLHRLLLVDERLVVPMYAHYPVMRSILEAASLAKWILASDDRQERVLRSLRARAEDIKQDHSLRKNEIETLRSMDFVDTESETWHARIEDAAASNARRYAADQQKIRELTQRNGLSWQIVKGGLPPWIHLIESVSTIGRSAEWNTIPGSYAAGIWKVMSGLSHPSVSRSVNHSSIDRVDGSRGVASGTFMGKLSASLEWTDQALTVALNAASDAITLFTQRQRVVLLGL